MDGDGAGKTGVCHFRSAELREPTKNCSEHDSDEGDRA